MNKNEEKQKNEPFERVQMVAINPDGWQKIVNYINGVPIAFGNAKMAAEIVDILPTAMVIMVNMPKEKTEPEKTEG